MLHGTEVNEIVRGEQQIETVESLPNSLSLLRGILSSSPNSLRGGGSARYGVVAKPIILSECSGIRILAYVARR